MQAEFLPAFHNSGPSHFLLLLELQPAGIGVGSAQLLMFSVDSTQCYGVQYLLYYFKDIWGQNHEMTTINQNINIWKYQSFFPVFTIASISEDKITKWWHFPKYSHTRMSGAYGPLVLAPAEGVGALQAPCLFVFFYYFFLLFCIFFCIFFFNFLSIFSFCLFCLFLSFCLLVFLSFCPFAFLPFCIFAFLSFFLFVFLSFCLFVFLSFCLFIFLSLCLFVFLSFCIFVTTIIITGPYLLPHQFLFQSDNFSILPHIWP